MSSYDTYYRKNENGRYEKVGIRDPFIPDGVHLIYVEHKPGSKTTLSKMNISLEEAYKQVVILANVEKVTDLIYRACELYPCQKLTSAEAEEWKAFQQTAAGKKLCKGLYRKSAAEIARNVLGEMIS